MAMALPSKPHCVRKAVMSPPGDIMTLRKSRMKVRLLGRMGWRK
jgi:hypothetical protein